MRKPHLYHLSRPSHNLLYFEILGDFEFSVTDHDVISPEKVLYQLKGHLFVTLNFEFRFICGKGSRLNYLLNLTSHFHIQTGGVFSGLSHCLNYLQS